MSTTPIGPTPFDDEYFAKPYDRYAELREQGRIHRVLLPEGFPIWLVTGYDDVYDALNDKRLVRSRKYANSDYKSELLPEAVRDGNLHMEDGEVHTRLRRFMNYAFTPKRINALRPRMDELADDLLERLAAAGGGDLMAAYAEPLPIAIIAEMLGIPRDMGGDFHEWSDRIMCGIPEEAQAAGGSLIRYTYELIARKRAEPRDDLLSHWVHGKDEDGKGMTEHEIVGMTFFLLLGGYVTTFGSFGTAMLGLLLEPEKAEYLRTHPERISVAVEEFLRWDGSGQNSIRRFAIDDMELAGTRIGKGDTVMLSLGSANRDPRRFSDPDELRLDREECPHLSFGRGPHHCPGKELARVELQVMISKILAKFPSIKLAEPAEGIPWRHSYTFRAPRRLPVTV